MINEVWPSLQPRSNQGQKSDSSDIGDAEVDSSEELPDSAATTITAEQTTNPVLPQHEPSEPAAITPAKPNLATPPTSATSAASASVTPHIQPSSGIQPSSAHQPKPDVPKPAPNPSKKPNAWQRVKTFAANFFKKLFSILCFWKRVKPITPHQPASQTHYRNSQQKPRKVNKSRGKNSS